MHELNIKLMLVPIFCGPSFDAGLCVHSGHDILILHKTIQSVFKPLNKITKWTAADNELL